ncbi:hypothetical protein [Mesomycoplasma lagogenitalium]|uniref:Uncharacterized protein n=1 Tax=Mesomycoplasma lagogenitalium TaxID=171286 RepID=A0ABY8LTF9_9BACT|nr:hypothetical protein [Mesomycoplasma lagogenitalium]WGI36530.1 hypothetical protein QEG99_03635 [Mesomycoplasma lagogenitalium]
MKIALNILNLTASVPSVIVSNAVNNDVLTFDGKLENEQLNNNKILKTFADKDGLFTKVQRDVVKSWIKDIEIRSKSSENNLAYLAITPALSLVTVLIVNLWTLKEKSKKFRRIYYSVLLSTFAINLVVVITVYVIKNNKQELLRNYQNDFNKFFLAMHQYNDAKYEPVAKNKLKELVDQINEKFPGIINFYEFETDWIEDFPNKNFTYYKEFNNKLWKNI